MNNYPQRTCLNVTGFGKEVDRRTLLTEFRKFGKVTKLYIEPSGSFANVFFADRQSAETAHSQLNNSLLQWQVSFDKISQNNMAHYDDDYYDEDLSENFEYCNIHGQPLVVLQADSGDLYVNLKDIRKTGFALFRRDTFNSVLVDTRQIAKEFELHLLSEAKNYILKNRVGCIDEEQILKTIERCKNKLLGDNTPRNLGPNRSVLQTSKSISITSTLDSAASNSGFQLTPQSSHHRPPKTLPNNFMPTSSQRGSAKPATGSSEHHHGPQGRRDNSRYNGASASNFSAKAEADLNSSSSSEKSFNYKKSRSGGFEPSNKPQRNREEIPRINFEQGLTYSVTVSHKEEKENICWVQDHRYAKELEDVFIQVNELVNDLEPIDPVHGQLVAAKYEGTWNRGRVLKTDPPLIHFLDYGNRSSVDQLKPLPDALKTMPALAARVVLNGRTDVKEDTILKIKIKQKYEDGTFLASVLETNSDKSDTDTTPPKLNEARADTPKDIDDTVKEKSAPEENLEKPKQKAYFSIPKPVSELQDGDKVMLIDVETKKLVVRTRECAVKSKTISDYIKNLDKSALILNQVKVGQLVLCSKDGYNGLFRAVVAKRDNDLIVTVKYVDFPGEAELSVKSLRNVDNFLAKEPATLLMTPEYKCLEDVNSDASEYLSKICQNKEKFTVILSTGNFDLQRDDGSLLSETLADLKCPMPILKDLPKRPSSSQKEAPKTEPIAESKPAAGDNSKVLYDEMDYIKIEPGLYTLMCYCLQDLDDITFLSSSDEVINHLETITNVIPSDKDPYTPEGSEMCLVTYKGPDDDDATWYRAVVLSVEEDEYTVNFVDFGNLETVRGKDIRKFPAHLKDVPILGIGCSCVGIPHKLAILERMKELIPEGTQVDVVIKRLDGLKYEIEMPEIYKQLKSEKLF